MSPVFEELSNGYLLANYGVYWVLIPNPTFTIRGQTSSRPPKTDRLMSELENFPPVARAYSRTGQAPACQPPQAVFGENVCRDTVEWNGAVPG